MRLLRFATAHFFDDQPLELDLARRRHVDGEPSLAFLVGPNGTGKSRALEMLGQVFRALSSGVFPPVEFQLEYELGDTRVFVGSSPPRGVPSDAPMIDKLSCVVLRTDSWDGTWRAEHALTRLPSDADEWLPRRIVGMSSGPTSRLGRALNPRYDALSGREGDEAETSEDDGDDESRAVSLEQLARFDQPRCIALSSIELRLAILALLTHPEVSAEDPRRVELLDRVGLPHDGGLVAFNIELAPDWSARIPDQVSALERLLARASRVVDGQQPAARYDDPDEVRRCAVFEVDGKTLPWLVSDLLADEPLIWFDRLLSWSRRGAITRTELVLRKVSPAGLLTTSDLSDGEFLMLGRYALLLLLADRGGALVLMDEPETHFNDIWKVELIAHLVRVLSASRGADDVLVATHSDLTLTDAERGNVFVFDGERVSEPGYSTFAADRDEVALAVGAGTSTGGKYSESVVQDAIETNDKEQLTNLLERTGPGFNRFRLRLALEDEDVD